MEPEILIEVFHGPQDNCSTCGGCGAQDTGAAAGIAARLFERFGGRVAIRFIDVFEVNLNDYPKVVAALRDGYLFPIITFNGHPRLAGALNLDDLYEELVEMGY